VIIKNINQKQQIAAIIVTKNTNLYETFYTENVYTIFVIYNNRF